MRVYVARYIASRITGQTSPLLDSILDDYWVEMLLEGVGRGADYIRGKETPFYGRSTHGRFFICPLAIDTLRERFRVVDV